MTDLKSSTFYDMLPPNLKSENTKALSAALDRQFINISDYIRKTLIYADISNLDEKLCDFLALSFDIKAYNFSLSLDKKRALIRIGIGAHSKKGTALAVKEIVETVFNGDVDIQEWFEYRGRTHCFRISLDGDRNYFSPHYEEVIKPVSYYKNLRSHLEAIDVVRRKQAHIFTGATQTVTTRIETAPRSAIGSRRTGEIKAGFYPVQYTRLFIRPYDGATVRRQNTPLVAACGRAEITQIKIPAYRRDI